MTAIVIIIIVFVAIRVIAQIISDNQAKEYQKQRNDNRRNASLESPVRKNKLGAYSKSIVYEELSRPGQFGNIFVYSDAKTIVICGREYKFDEIVECHLESQGATYVTTPDRYEMAREQFLYGMGQKYNVRTQTQVYNNPDKVLYYDDLPEKPDTENEEVCKKFCKQYWSFFSDWHKIFKKSGTILIKTL